MCGIIGYVGSRKCKAILLQGLERLEYRGYDSSGLAFLEEDGLDYVVPSATSRTCATAPARTTRRRPQGSGTRAGRRTAG